MSMKKIFRRILLAFILVVSPVCFGGEINQPIRLKSAVIDTRLAEDLGKPPGAVPAVSRYYIIQSTQALNRKLAAEAVDAGAKPPHQRL